MGFFEHITVYKILGIVFIIAGALLGFLCKKFASLSKNKEEAYQNKLSWIYKIAGLGLVVAAFIMILNA